MAFRIVLLLVVACATRLVFGQDSASLPNATESVFILKDDSNNDTDITCLRLDARITFIFNYNTTVNETVNVTVPFVNDNSTETNAGRVEIDHDMSTCNVEHPYAELAIKYSPPNEQSPYYLFLVFTGSRKPGNQAWMFEKGSMSVNFTYHSSMFPKHHGQAPNDNSDYEIATNASLFDETNQRIELTRQYICNSAQTFKDFEPIVSDNSFRFFLNISNLEVQAFNFSSVFLNSTDFSPPSSARQCILDLGTQGNVVVPIAVGAALAVLVSIVIVAYLISRIRNKRRGSYEALSS